MNPAQTLITAEKLRLGYRRGPDVVSDIDAEIRSGEILCVIGPNGGGKTTLLRSLSGLLPPRSGSVLLERYPLYGRGALDRRVRARSIAVVLTRYVAPAYLRVRELVSLGRLPYQTYRSHRNTWKHDHDAVQHALEQSGITSLANRPVGELSDGERQRAMVARALAQEPRILMLDEPTVHLDPPHQSALFLLLRDLIGQGVIESVTVATHHLHLALHFSDRILLVADGTVETGSPSTFLSTQKLERAFNNGTERHRLVLDPLRGWFTPTS